jgi:hypothetical protein
LPNWLAPVPPNWLAPVPPNWLGRYVIGAGSSQMLLCVKDG